MTNDTIDNGSGRLAEPPLSDADISLSDRFRATLARNPDADIFHFCDEQGKSNARLTRAELDQHARRIASLLHEQGLVAGDRALLVYSFSLDVIPAFLGCFMAGVIPCPVAPVNPMKIANDLPRFEKLAADSGCKAVLTNREYARYRQLGTIRAPLLTRNTAWRSLPWLKTDVELPDPVTTLHVSAPDDIAFLQYTSGSTSDPKGVMISHRNLAAQIDALNTQIVVGDDSRLVAWIPYFHDYCLVAGIANVMMQGGELHLMSPLGFLSNPAGWFEVLTRVGGTGTAAPNFAFDYAVQKTTDAQRRQWDLSSVETLQSGGEPIHADAVDRFFKAFSVSGLRPPVFTPAYGMAEHVLGIAIAGVQRISIDRVQYEQAKHVVPSDAPSALKLVGNGKPLSGVCIEIVDAQSSQALPPDHVGEIWIDSACKALGYWRQPEQTEETFAARLQMADGRDDARRFLRTGDLGFLHEGELFVAGRIKDTIIIRGRNIYPQDVEAVVSMAHESIHHGRIVAFGLNPANPVADANTDEVLGVIVELHKRRRSTDDYLAIVDTIRQQVTASLAVSCHTVVLSATGGVSKTSSGKHQRQKSRARYLDGELQSLILYQDSEPAEQPDEPPCEVAGVLSEQSILNHLLKLAAVPEDRQAVNVDDPVSQLAIDSVRIMSIVVEMNRWTGRQLDSTQLADMLNQGSLRDVARAYLNAESATPANDAGHAHTGVQGSHSASSADQYFPLNPSQAWMFEPEGPVPHLWTITGMVQAPTRVDVDKLQQALGNVVQQHEALRLRLVDQGDGWEQRLLASDAPQVSVADLTHLGNAEVHEEIETIVAERKQALNMIDGPIVDLLALHLRDPLQDRILFTVHHIAVDAYSFELVAADLLRGYDQLMRGSPASFPAPNRHYSAWMQGLIALSSSAELNDSAESFMQVPDPYLWEPDMPKGRCTEDSALALSQWLSEDQCEKLLTRIPLATGLPSVMLILTALVQSLQERTSHPVHRFELVHHGRKDVWPDIDLTTTCGWISINCPVTLTLLPELDPLAQARHVQGMVDALPRKGLDFGVLRYLHADAAVRHGLQKHCATQMKFNWFGQTRGLMNTLHNGYPLVQEHLGPGFNPDGMMHYLHYFYGTQVGGRIRLDVSSSKACVLDQTREELLAGWLKHIDHLIAGWAES